MGPKQLQRYIQKLQEKFDAGKQNIDVEAGFGLPSSTLRTYDEKPIRAWSRNEDVGVGTLDDVPSFAASGAMLRGAYALIA